MNAQFNCQRLIMNIMLIPSARLFIRNKSRTYSINTQCAAQSRIEHVEPGIDDLTSNLVLHIIIHTVKPSPSGDHLSLGGRPASKEEETFKIVVNVRHFVILGDSKRLNNIAIVISHDEDRGALAQIVVSVLS